MPSYSKTKHGHRAQVYVRGQRESKVLPTKGEVKAWAEAREKELKRASSEITFKVAAERWLARRLKTVKNADFARTIEQRVTDYLLPDLGDFQVAHIRRPQLVAIMERLDESGRTETAKKVGQYICAIMDSCVDRGEIESHPGARLSRVLASKESRPMPAVKLSEVGELLLRIENLSTPVVRLAMLVAAHTALRSREFRGGEWSELVMDDKAGPVWLVPAERMKREKMHVVPLSPQMLGYLAELKALAGDSRFMFPSPRGTGGCIDGSTLIETMYRLGYHSRMTVHGWRSIFSTAANESQLWGADVIERGLAHQGSNLVREAYHRAEYLAQRRELMPWYSNWLDAQRDLALRAVSARTTSE